MGYAETELRQHFSGALHLGAFLAVGPSSNGDEILFIPNLGKRLGPGIKVECAADVARFILRHRRDADADANSSQTREWSAIESGTQGFEYANSLVIQKCSCGVVTGPAQKESMVCPACKASLVGANTKLLTPRAVISGPHAQPGFVFIRWTVSDKAKQLNESLEGVTLWNNLPDNRNREHCAYVDEADFDGVLLFMKQQPSGNPFPQLASEFATDILRRAADILSGNQSTIQVRLCTAGVLLARIDGRDFWHVDLGNEFTEINELLSPLCSPNGAITNVMDDKTAQCLADRIHRFFFTVKIEVWWPSKRHTTANTTA